MNNFQEYIAENFDNMLIGLDDTFTFNCEQCGKCCTEREDIMLSAQDMYRMSKKLDMTPQKFYETYCESYVGHSSNMIVVRLKPRGYIKRCPLLKDRKCMVHDVKPAVCAMFPIGRAVRMEKLKDGSTLEVTYADVQYITNSVHCGNGMVKHAVREWLNAFNIPLEDEFFIKWQNTIIKLSNILTYAVEKLPEEAVSPIWNVVFMALYLHYDTSKEFMPQFDENARVLLKIIPEFLGELGIEVKTA